MNHLLESYQLQRYDWAFKAKEDYLDKFRAFEAANRKISSKRLVISVYGPTQVGKSTLILTLLGVKNVYLRRVSKFLRGKRDTGKSATVTVTVYQISPTDYFQVKLPSKKAQPVKTEEELEILLAQLRHDIEEGLTQSVEPLVIAIPNYMFEQSEHLLEIIDLPGIESAEQKEIQHIERCIDYWIPNSHICLIVNSANDLTFLRDIEMPQLKKWHEYESNYFLVLTRAITPKSIANAIQDGKILTSDNLTEYYKDFIENILKHRQGSVFPLEVGDSFENLDEKEQQLVRDSLQALKIALHETDIHNISFKHLSSYYRDVLGQAEVELRSLDDQLEEKIKFIKELKSNQKNSSIKNKKKLDKVKDDMDILNAELREIWNSDFSFTPYEKRIEQVMKDSPISKRASCANKLISNLIISIEDEVNEKIRSLNLSFKKIANDFEMKNVKPIEEVSIDFTFWDNSKVNKYFSKLNYLEKRRAMGLDLNEVLAEKLNAVQGEFSMQLKSIKYLKKDLENALYNAEVILRSESQKYEEILERENEVKHELQKRLGEVHDIWGRDKAHALQYKNYFIKHFIIRKDELLKMAASEEYGQQYLAFLFLQVLGEDAKKIIDSMGIEHIEYKSGSKNS